MTKKRFLGILLSLVMLLGLMPGMSLSAYAAPLTDSAPDSGIILGEGDDPYSSINNTATVITFDSKDWFLINYDSSTLTLFLTDSVGTSKFDDDSNQYSGSIIETYVNNWYDSNITANAKTAVNGNMFLLSTDEAKALSKDVRASCSKWYGVEFLKYWLRTPGNGNDNYDMVAYANGEWEYPLINEYGKRVSNECGVRPTLKLNRSSVTFSSVNLSGGTNAAVSGGAVAQNYFKVGNSRGAMTPVVYTAKANCKFPETSDLYKTEDGITVARTSDTVVTVSGTPTKTVLSVTVPDAVISAQESIETDVVEKDGTPKTEVEGLDKELAESLLTESEKEKVKAGDEMRLYLEMTNIDDSVSDAEKTLTENKAKEADSGAVVGMFLDLSLYKKIGNGVPSQLSSTGGRQLTIKITVPSNLRAESGVKRTFYIIKIHNGAASVIAKTTGTEISFTTGEFSTYALAYADEGQVTGFYSGLKVAQKNDRIKINWDKTDGVSKYELYVTYCGEKFKTRAAKTTKNSSVSIKKINGNKIDFSRNIKMFVIAYDGNGSVMGKSITGHVAGKESKKYKNPKSISVSEKSLTLSAGQSSKVKATVKMEKGKKKALSDEHAAKIRYKSTNENVAKVSDNGTVTGIGTGTCQIYVYARNGLAKKVTVTVN
ncbi:MAG: hypothetical protein E7301_05535 [Butyrivibrio sp.]|nr:hypothetical protein [Butyrivibrio sp.]